MQEAGFGCGDPGEQQCGDGFGIFGGKAGAEKQTGEQTGQEDEQQDGSDFSHGEVPLLTCGLILEYAVCPFDMLMFIVNESGSGYNRDIKRGKRMYTDDYMTYLKKEKRMSENTRAAYGRDLAEFVAFEGARGMTDLLGVTSTEIIAFLHHLKSLGKSSATVNRKLASLRSFFHYLIHAGMMESDPTENIKSPKIERKTIEYLEMSEIEKLMAVPDDSVRGVRDRAILEVLYATGIRVSELIASNLEDVNMRMGFITCAGEQSHARIVPLGRPARAALENYIYEARDQLLRGKEEEQALFINFYGNRMTRQGLWKILKEYGEKAELSHKLTPHIIRNSFAVHMLQNGADLKSLQELMGHEDISATQIYLSATKSRIKDVYDKSHPRA